MSRKRYFSIEIPNRHSQCTHAEERLEAGQEVYSAIFESDQAFSREDYCSQCWTQVEKEAHIKNAVTYWKSVVPEKKEVKEIFLDRDSKALALLKELVKSEEEEKLHQAMILAIYLSRRRKIYQRKEFVTKENQTYLLFEESESKEILSVPKIPLASIDIPKVQKTIAQQLKN